ncbi:MAG: type II/IV secretion system protein [Elusimicrobiota bacterium]
MPHRFKDEWLVRAALTLPGMNGKELECMRESGKPWLAHLIIEAGRASPDELLKAVQSVHCVDSADPGPGEIDKMALGLIPEKVCRARTVLPYRAHGDSIEVLTCAPIDMDLLQDVQAVCGRQPRALYVLPERLLALIDGVYKGDSVVFELLKRVEEKDKVEVVDAVQAAAGAESPVIRLVDSLIARAVRMGASDIHVEHEETSSVVRMRVDGILKTVLTLPRVLAAGAVVSRIKIMANLDVAEHQQPQDGRAKLRVGGVDIGLRVSTLPTTWGEKVVLRVLDRRTAEVPLGKLGLRPDLIERLKKLLALPQGLLFVTGPTGSGKTTTLYSILSSMKTGDTNIVTVEDPVEYRLEGINQVQVNEKRGLTFAGILRSVLRQDPDIILVGEVRDHETADIALQAALTGHVVLSSLHTNDAVGAVPRLADMGAERFKIASGLVGVLAQRLVRRLCPDCRTKGDPSKLDADLRALMEKWKIAPAFMEAKGCLKCDFSGYKGRLPLLELFEVDAGMREKISVGMSEGALRQEALNSGMLSPLSRDAAWHVAGGDTSVVEALPFLGLEASRPSEAKAPAESAPVPSLKKRVLVADDDAVVRVIMRQVLVKEGYEVEEAVDGVKALERVAAWQPDLLVCDLNMPNLDGFGVIRSVRENLGRGDLPIIVMTAETDDRSQETALALGADDYIVKPTKPPIILARIRGIFRRLEK